MDDTQKTQTDPIAPNTEEQTENNIPSASGEEQTEVLKKQPPGDTPEEKAPGHADIYAGAVPGAVVKVYQKVKETTSKGTERERIQFFEGTVISRRHGGEKGSTITVRKISHGVGVEKIYPLHSPTIVKIEILRQLKTNRSKLYFLSRGYKKRIKEQKT